MNESPETGGDPKVHRLLAESNIEESPELLEGLRLLRSFCALPAPEPTGELATLLKTANPPRQWTQTHRGLILSFALAGAMAAGTTGVAASNALRLTCESFTGGATEPAQPKQEDSGETAPLPPASSDAQAPSPEAALSPEPAPSPAAGGRHP